MGKPALSEEKITQIFKLYLENKSAKEISEKLGVSYATVLKYIKMGEIEDIKKKMEKENKKPKVDAKKKQPAKKTSNTTKKVEKKKEKPMITEVDKPKKEVVMTKKSMTQDLLDIASIKSRLKRNKNLKVGILMPSSCEDKKVKAKKEEEYDELYGEDRWYWMSRDEMILNIMVKIDDMKLDGSI